MFLQYLKKKHSVYIMMHVNSHAFLIATFVAANIIKQSLSLSLNYVQDIFEK